MEIENFKHLLLLVLTKIIRQASKNYEILNYVPMQFIVTYVSKSQFNENKKYSSIISPYV